MERTRYNMVVRKCELDKDFSLFPRGDKTIVGERGVSLSGGTYSIAFNWLLSSIHLIVF